MNKKSELNLKKGVMRKENNRSEQMKNETRLDWFKFSKQMKKGVDKMKRPGADKMSKTQETYGREEAKPNENVWRMRRNNTYLSVARQRVQSSRTDREGVEEADEKRTESDEGMYDFKGNC
jgi:hypothetical protein